MQPKILRLWTLLLLLGIAFFLSAQDNGTTLTPEQVVDLKLVTSAKIQPQGQYVAYQLRVPRGAHEGIGGGYSELWVANLQDGSSRPYVRKPLSVSSLNWTPDGKLITFLASRKSTNKFRQVYAIPVDGGEAYQLSHSSASISSYAVSPDGKKIAYRLTDEEPDSMAAMKKHGFDAQVEDSWSRIARVHVEDLSSGNTHVATQGDEHVWEFGWTPDSRNIIYLASDRPFIDDKYMFTDNYVVAAAGGTGTKIHDTDGKLALAKMAPDGKRYAWLGATDFNDPYTGSLFVKKAGAEGAKNMTVDVPFTAESFLWLDEKTILLTALEDTRKTLYRVKLKGNDAQVEKIMGDTGPIFGGLSVANDNKTIAVIASTGDHPEELYSGQLGGGEVKRVTHSNPDIAGMSFGEQYTIRWKGPDNWDISGVLVLPVGYKKGNRYPLQIQVHGGPEGARQEGWNTRYNRWVQLLAQRGIMVLIPNYRGSIGKGVAFSKGDHADMMGKEFDDILAGIDYLDAEGMIDPERVGIGGGSYGGYASAWAATKHSDRFAASVVFVGISNQISKAGNTDTPVENAEVHWTQWLYDDFDFTWDRSPLKHIHGAKTPTLILHGREDRRVPVNQAYELYRGLKYVGAETELVIYPREGHGNRERAHQLDLCRRVLDWYVQHLGLEAGSAATEL